jgi:hypothetical protein
MKPIRAGLIIVLLAASAGCAGQESMRHLAGTSAGVLNDYRREMKVFADRQTALNGDIDRSVRDFAELQAMREGTVEQGLLALRVAGDKPAVDAYALLTARSAADIVSQNSLLRPAQPAVAAPAITFDASSLERLTRQLNELRRPRSYWEQLLRAVSYRNELQQAYQASLQSASTSTAEAGSQTNETASAVGGSN